MVVAVAVTVAIVVVLSRDTWFCNVLFCFFAFLLLASCSLCCLYVCVKPAALFT